MRLSVNNTTQRREEQAGGVGVGGGGGVIVITRAPILGYRGNDKKSILGNGVSESECE